MNCDLGQGLVKGGPLVNFSVVVVHLPEYLVLRPSASWRFLKISWVGALRHNATEVEDCIQNVSLRPGRPRRRMPQMPRTQLIIFADVPVNPSFPLAAPGFGNWNRMLLAQRGKVEVIFGVLGKFSF